MELDIADVAKTQEEYEQDISDGKPVESDDSDLYQRLSLTNWFTTFMLMSIPIIGIIYILFVSFGKEGLKKDFARAYLLYQIIFISIAFVCILIFSYFGLEILDNALKFMQEL